MINFQRRKPELLPDPQIIQVGINRLLVDEPAGIHDEFQYIEGANLAYQGFVRDLRQEMEHPVSHAHTILTGARLLRASIDEKIKSDGRTLDFDEVAVTASLFLALFRQDGNTHKDNFLKSPAITALKGRKTVRQQHDSTTCRATEPDNVEKAVIELGQKIGDDQLLFLNICHGGLIPGGAVYSLHQQENPSPYSFFYPVRYSRSKHKDKTPRLTDNEKKAIEKLARGREVVIFDEDIATGRTLDTAQEYLQEVIGKSALTLTTLDARKDFLHFDEAYSPAIDKIGFAN